MRTIRNTRYGKIQGIDCTEYIKYLGIPFARPPVGALRFEEPQAPDSWDGILVADHFREKAIQPELENLPLWGREFYGDPDYQVAPSEDCLYLNIWTPANACEKEAKVGNEKFPVAVWIHGGAFKNGYASEMEFDGEGYAGRGVILVTIAYRCNVFGFLPTPGEGHRANLGLQDQIMALKWVQENISAFGGDPENVTLFGQSAGAMSAMILCNSPLTKGLFHKVIFQSGAGYRSELNRSMEPRLQKQIYAELLEACRCRSLEELKQVPAMTLYQAYEQTKTMQEIQILTPCVDGYVLPEGVDASIAEGRMHLLPCLMGANKDDLWMQTPGRDVPEGDLWEGMLRLADILKERQNAPYLYYFAHALPGSEDGAFHSAELWYTFGTLNRCWRPMGRADQELAEELQDRWANFMKYGSPDRRKGQTDWLPYPAEFKIFQ